ncbi:MAG: glycosyltransferase [Leptolyngbya sp. Prado105]|nr:glycosyltransferase [Leptolyngbya sp. Prado105]
MCKILFYALISALNPFRLNKAIGALLLVLGWYRALAAKDKQYDWIHADFGKGTATVALMLSEVLKCPFSFKVHAFDIYSTDLNNLDLLQRIKLNRAAIVFSEHNFGRQKLLDIFPECDQKIQVNYTAIRTNDFQPLSSNPLSRRFVALGRLVPKKGFSVLIEAASILKSMGENVAVDIYGSGSEEQELLRLIEQYHLNDSVQLKGRYKNDDLQEILTDYLAVIVPSVVCKNGDMDGVPTVIYEAMALGRSVIASSLSGIPEIVKNGENGYLVQPGDAQELASKMKALIVAPHLASQMGMQGRKLVEIDHDYLTNSRTLISAINLYQAS